VQQFHLWKSVQKKLATPKNEKCKRLKHANCPPVRNWLNKLVPPFSGVLVIHNKVRIVVLWSVDYLVVIVIRCVHAHTCLCFQKETMGG